MYSLVLHDYAKDDLEAIWQSTDADAAAVIQAFLEQAKLDQDLLDRFSSGSPFKNSTVDIAQWRELWNKGFNLWRLKLLELESISIQYRIIYAFDPQKLRYFVLGILPREFDYRHDDPRTQRIIDAYANLDLPKY